jgi:hypothetical protein
MTHTDDPSPKRRFGLIDAMILVAAAAAAFGCMRAILPTIAGSPDGSIAYYRASIVVGPVAATAATLAALLIRAWPPRPAGAAWKGRPGFVASLAATAACSLIVADILIDRGAYNLRYAQSGRFAAIAVSHIAPMILPVSLAVGGAWLALWLAGMWRREKTWIDDLGIAVGASWIALEATRMSYRLTYSLLNVAAWFAGSSW